MCFPPTKSSSSQKMPIDDKGSGGGSLKSSQAERYVSIIFPFLHDIYGARYDTMDYISLYVTRLRIAEDLERTDIQRIRA